MRLSFGRSAEVSATPSGLTATGGVISDYTDPGPGLVYRAHIFTSTGTFSVSAPGTFGDTVEYVVVAGGGGGSGATVGSGGGAGGYRSSVTGESSGGGNSAEASFPVSTSPGAYTVTIGAGGPAGPTSANSSVQGGPSSFGPITSTGGGGGKQHTTGGSGGSGGGAGDYPRGGRGGPADNYPGPSAQGYPGGQGASDQATYTAGGGGGGAGGSGQGAPNGPNPQPNPNLSGGNGIRTGIVGPGYSIGTPGPASPGGYGGGPSTAVTGGWLAGGGGGGLNLAPSLPGSGGAGGGGGSGGSGVGNAGTYATGGGGGSGSSTGAAGGSGIVVVRYQIASLTAALKATGGAISFYSGKTIHTFTSTGIFTAPGSFSETVEYFTVGGGGGGGGTPSPGSSGGAGGGGYKTATIPLAGPFAAPVTVGAGGGRNTNGVDSVFAAPSPQTGGGGGYGGPRPSAGNPAPLGSGGAGGSGASGGTGGPQGTSGGNGDGGSGVAGGGGGAGQAGQNANGTSPGLGGYGGYGVQVPTTFRNPVSAPTPTGGGIGDDGTYGASPDGAAPQPGSYWFAGGGGGGGQTNNPTYAGGRGGSGGGGKGGTWPSQAPIDGQNGLTNTGGGGGGGGNDGSGKGGLGGSGIVIIAYPS